MRWTRTALRAREIAGRPSGCERSIRAGRATMLRTAKPCGPGARGWRQALRRRNSPNRVRVSPSIRKATEARGIRLRGERGISRKAIAQGRPDALRWTCMLVCAFFVRKCTRDRGCSAHPVFPAPSHVRGSKRAGTTRARRAAGTRWHIRISDLIRFPPIIIPS